MNITGRPIVQKHPRVEVKSLRDLCHTAPCFATFPHVCNAHLGCHPAHNNWQAFGKGVHVKTSDHLIASVCGTAHRILDGKIGHDAMPKDERLYNWIQAFVSTNDYFWANGLIVVARKRA